jgi:hypothetical protein
VTALRTIQQRKDSTYDAWNEERQHIVEKRCREHRAALYPERAEQMDGGRFLDAEIADGNGQEKVDEIYDRNGFQGDDCGEIRKRQHRNVKLPGIDRIKRQRVDDHADNGFR